MANIQQNTVIDGAVITPECSVTIKKYQDEDNAYLKDQAMLIADAICYISKFLMGREPIERDEKKAVLIISDLAFLKDDILKLAKP